MSDLINSIIESHHLDIALHQGRFMLWCVLCGPVAPLFERPREELVAYHVAEVALQGVDKTSEEALG